MKTLRKRSIAPFIQSILDAAWWLVVVSIGVLVLISGLAILVVAEVFREGARLHEEQSWTI